MHGFGEATFYANIKDKYDDILFDIRFQIEVILFC